MFALIVVIEILRLRLEPLVAASPCAAHLCRASSPAPFMGSYFIALQFTEGTSWSIHMTAEDRGRGGDRGVGC